MRQKGCGEGEREAIRERGEGQRLDKVRRGRARKEAIRHAKERKGKEKGKSMVVQRRVKRK